MELTALILIFTTIFTTALAQIAFPPPATARYRLKTCLKPNQPGKQRFDNLWLDAYHTGAGVNDATFSSPVQNYSAVGYLSATNQSSSTGQPYYNQIIDLGNPFPWSMIMEPNVEFYSSWQPVEINAGTGSGPDYGGFFIDSDGLEWDNNPNSTDGEFGGWLVCEWWHGGVPQLFFRIPSNNGSAPCSCADVWLVPQYI